MMPQPTNPPTHQPATIEPLKSSTLQPINRQPIYLHIISLFLLQQTEKYTKIADTEKYLF